MFSAGDCNICSSPFIYVCFTPFLPYKITPKTCKWELKENKVPPVSVFGGGFLTALFQVWKRVVGTLRVLRRETKLKELKSGKYKFPEWVLFWQNSKVLKYPGWIIRVSFSVFKMQYKLHEQGCDASYLWWLCPGAKHCIPKSLPLFSAIVMTVQIHCLA